MHNNTPLRLPDPTHDPRRADPLTRQLLRLPERTRAHAQAEHEFDLYQTRVPSVRERKRTLRPVYPTASQCALLPNCQPQPRPSS